VNDEVAAEDAGGVLSELSARAPAVYQTAGELSVNTVSLRFVRRKLPTVMLSLSSKISGIANRVLKI
jgi:hypothetical protein